MHQYFQIALLPLALVLVGEVRSDCRSPCSTATENEKPTFIRAALGGHSLDSWTITRTSR